MYKDDYNFPDFMNSTSFWMKNIPNAEDIILSEDSIMDFNKSIINKLPFLYFLETEEESIASEVLHEYICSYKLPSKDMYDYAGKLIEKDFYHNLLQNINLDGIRELNFIRYGMSTRKTNVRSFPGEDAIFSSIKDSSINNFDRLQETSCALGEPLLILHQSRDEKWYFVKLYNYMGWVKADDIALCESKEELFHYTNCKDFIVITGKEETVTIFEKENNTTYQTYGMGTKLCLEVQPESGLEDYYIIKLPSKDIDGRLCYKKARISRKQDVVRGYLPYTTINVINQALKYLNTPYDWGDKFTGKDCSGFIMTVYKCFGFLLPRNASEQARAFTDEANSVAFSKEDSISIRYSKMDKLRPGAAIFMPGHVMMYLGKYMDKHYMIHSFSGYGVKVGATYESRSALCVAISPVDMPTASGVPFIERFSSAVYYM